MINRPAPARIESEPEKAPEPVRQTIVTEPEMIPEPVVQESRQPEKTENIVQNIPETEKTSVEDLPLDQSAFLHSLWQSASAAGRQKEIFAPYAGREV